MTKPEYRRNEVKRETKNIINDEWPILSVTQYDELCKELELIDKYYYQSIAEEYYGS